MTTPAAAMTQRLGMVVVWPRGYHFRLMPDAVQPFDVVRFDQRRSCADVDRIAAEAPLEVRLEGRPFSVIMRTPGADQDLAAGFLFSEGVIAEAGEIQHIDIGASPNAINVSLAPSRAA